MALGEIPPWLNTRPADFMAAAEAGAETGMRVGAEGNRLTLEAAGLRQRGDIAAAELAQRAFSDQQQIALAGAKLQQAGEIARMELEAKKEQAAVAAARLAQEHEMEFAYKQAQLGLAAGRLNMAAQTAQQKQDVLARQFAARSAFQQYISDQVGRGVPEQEAVLEGWKQFGMDMGAPPAAYMTALTRAESEATPFEPEIITKDGIRIARTGPKRTQVLTSTPSLEEKAGFEELKSVYQRMARTTDEETLSGLRKDRDALISNLKDLEAKRLGGAAAPATGTGGGGGSSAGWQFPWNTNAVPIPPPTSVTGTTAAPVPEPAPAPPPAEGTTNAPVAEPKKEEAWRKVEIRTKEDADRAVAEAQAAVERAPSRREEIMRRLEEKLAEAGFRLRK